MSHQVKPSRLLARLEAEIVGASTPVAADRKRAERAAYLARVGRIDEAKAVVATLRQLYDKRPDIEISIWLHLVEGLICYFTDLNPAALNMIQRAHALSTAADLRPLRALTAAWLAQMEYARHGIQNLAQYSRLALDMAGTNHHATRARATLVVGQTLHLAGCVDRARKWYARARFHTLPDGDDAATSALMHNMASVSMMTLRQSILAGTPPVNVGGNTRVWVDSHEHFDERSGISSLPSLGAILRAQTHSLEGDYAGAFALYDSHLALATAGGAQRMQAHLLADRAWCRLQLGQLESARQDALAAMANLEPRTQIDDRAVAHSRLAQVFEGLGESAKAAEHADLAKTSWLQFEALQREIIEALSDLSPDA